MGVSVSVYEALGISKNVIRSYGICDPSYSIIAVHSRTLTRPFLAAIYLSCHTVGMRERENA